MGIANNELFLLERTNTKKSVLKMQYPVSNYAFVLAFKKTNNFCSLVRKAERNVEG